MIKSCSSTNSLETVVKAYQNTKSVSPGPVKRLDLSAARLDTFPLLPATVEHVLLNRNTLKKLELTQVLENLKTLHLSYNEIGGIAFGCFIQLPVLQRLDLSFNFIKKIPASIKNLSGLTVLNLNGNNLTTLPLEMQQLKRLQVLDLSGNCFQMLQDELFEEKCELKELYLNDNPLEMLPDLSDLVVLQVLDISSTLIRHLPASLGKLGLLQSLGLDGLLLNDPSARIIEQGLPAILEYLTRRHLDTIHEQKEMNLNFVQESALSSNGLDGQKWTEQCLSCLNDSSIQDCINEFERLIYGCSSLFKQWVLLSQALFVYDHIQNRFARLCIVTFKGRILEWYKKILVKSLSDPVKVVKAAFCGPIITLDPLNETVETLMLQLSHIPSLKSRISIIVQDILGMLEVEFIQHLLLQPTHLFNLATFGAPLKAWKKWCLGYGTHWVSTDLLFGIMDILQGSENMVELILSEAKELDQYGIKQSHILTWISICMRKKTDYLVLETELKKRWHQVTLQPDLHLSIEWRCNDITRLV